MPLDAEFEQRLARVESLLAELARSSDPSVEQATRELLGTVFELHQRGLSRMLEITARDATVRDALSADPRVSAMLLLHGLHLISPSERISRALVTLRERHRAKLESLDFETTADASIRVRVVPRASACSSTRTSLKRELEDALIAAAPDLHSLVVEVSDPPPALITLRVPKGRSENPTLRGSR